MRNENKKLLQKAKIIIATHEYATGFAQHLEEYLKDKKNEKLFYIHHPLHPSYPNSKGSGYRLYYKGTLKKRIDYPNKYLHVGLLFPIHFLLNLWWTIEQRKKWDLYIGSNNLNAFSGILLKKLGFVRKCVFYTVDFIPKRFKNSFINNLYLWVDKICVKTCDETWILSPRMKEGRKHYFHLNDIYERKQVYVPEGVWFSRIKRKSFKDISKNTVVFLGVLLERMGVQLILQAIPLIIKSSPTFRFIIIGKGKHKPVLEQLVNKLHISQYVDFKGYVDDYREVEKIVARCALGVATYTSDPTGLIYYADPAKTKTYLGCGLPVVITNTFHNAKEIEKRGAGIIVKEDPVDIANAILALINNETLLKTYKENAIKLAGEFDNDVIFTKNLLRVLT